MTAAAEPTVAVKEPPSDSSIEANPENEDLEVKDAMVIFDTVINELEVCVCAVLYRDCHPNWYLFYPSTSPSSLPLILVCFLLVMFLVVFLLRLSS